MKGELRPIEQLPPMRWGDLRDALAAGPAQIELAPGPWQPHEDDIVSVQRTYLTRDGFWRFHFRRRTDAG